MRRRSIVLAATTLSLALAAPASAGAAGVDTDFVDRYTQAVYELDGPADSPLLRVQEKVVDTRGQVVRQASYTKEMARQGSIRPLNAAPFACLHDRERQGFQRHPQREMLERGGNEFVHFFYFPYSQADAQVLDGRPTQQWLICSTGGADAQNGSRTSVSGPVVGYKNEHTTYKLGHAWREGKTPADHTVTLGFQVGKGPVNVNGSIQQTPTEKIKGSPLALFNDNRYGRNQAAGWWEHGCRPVCRRWNGSADFQGSVVEALFEFPQGMPVRPTDFYYAASVEHFCSNPFGCRG